MPMPMPMPAPHDPGPEPAGASWIRPPFEDPRVLALMSTRQGGLSPAPWDSLNLGTHVGDAPDRVAGNRARVSAALGLPVAYLEQVHGVAVHAAQASDVDVPAPIADAVWSRHAGLAVAVQVADCLPVLLALRPQARGGPAVAAAHAGWRGLAAGVIEATVHRLCEATGSAPEDLEAWLGPCIGPDRFEVGPEVRQAFVAHDPAEAQAFRPGRAPGTCWADLQALARMRLAALGVHRVRAQAECTATLASRYFSFRRDGRTGRMVAAIGLRC